MLEMRMRLHRDSALIALKPGDRMQYATDRHVLEFRSRDGSPLFYPKQDEVFQGFALRISQTGLPTLANFVAALAGLKGAKKVKRQKDSPKHQIKYEFF